VILKSYLHIKTRHLVKILPTAPTCFSLSRPSSGSFVVPYFEVANASMLNMYGTAARYIDYRHAAAVPYILSIEALATSK